MLYASTMNMSSAHIFLLIYSTISLTRNKGFCTKGIGGCGIAYSVLGQDIGPAVLMQVQSESQRGRCKALASDQCCVQMASLQLGIKLSVLQDMV